MEQEFTARGGPELGMYACDRELFDRVWQRVMPEERPGCPIAVDAPPRAEEMPIDGRGGPVPEMTAAAAPPGQGPAPIPVPEASAPIPADVPAPVPPEAPEEGPAQREPPPEPPESRQPTGDDFPRPDAVPCLGSGSAGHGEQLREDILAALEGWQLYRHLARKVTGSAARTLSALASEKHRQGRKLAAAYFLISGVRYWPTDRLGTPHTSSWLGTLRRRFAAEQQLDSRWRAAALDTDDGCLAALYGELAEDCAAHAGMLRALLEQAL